MASMLKICYRQQLPIQHYSVATMTGKFTQINMFTAMTIIFLCNCENDSVHATVCQEATHEVDHVSQRFSNFLLFGKSEVTALSGHWPASYCRITNVFFRTSERKFYAGVENPFIVDRCFGTRDIWDVASKEFISPSVLDNDRLRCDQVYDYGHIFTLYYHHGSNYFHLYYDTALPLFSGLRWQEAASGQKKSPYSAKSTVFMPSVELNRGKGIDWDTDAFFNNSAYWNQLLQVVTYPNQRLPLDMRLVAIDKTLCFNEIFFGTPKMDISNVDFILAFASFVKSRLNITNVPDAVKAVNKRMGLIKRRRRRRILNEDQLVRALQPFIETELVDFADISLKDQVEMVQKYAILAGINGAGLMNAIYLPRESVAIQMIPFQAENLNHVEYTQLLQARGPYLEWRNNHSELDRPSPDRFGHNADTLVQVDEFVNVVKEALNLLH